MRRRGTGVLVWSTLAACLVGALLGLAPLGAAGQDRTPRNEEVRNAEPRAAAVIRFRGAGNGHGVGMSQYGALHRAEAGQSATDILGFYYPNTTVGPEAAPVTSVRVRVATSVRDLVITPTGRMAVLDGSTRLGRVSRPVVVKVRRGVISVVTDRGRVICRGRRATTCGDAIRIRHPQGSALNVTNGTVTTPFRWGRLDLRIVPGLPDVQVIVSRLPMERYLYGLAEVPASWPTATLQAQAIAGRSYADQTVRARRAAGGTLPWDLESGQSDQVYNGSAIELASWGAPWVAAVDATAGLVVRGADGRSVSTNYSASNGGYMESSAYVWGNARAHLVAAPDPFDIPSPFDSWERVYTSRELRRWLVARGYTDPGRIERIRVISGRGESGRINQALVRVTGRSAVVELSGGALFSAINLGLLAEGQPTRTLLSTRVSVRLVAPQ
jgi:SpoIID/LytB domain protein